MKEKSQSLPYIEGWLSIAVNVALFALKYWAGLSTGSVAILADAWHTLSDSLTSMVVILGARASVKPADPEHPFGHGRAELVASVVIGVLLAVVGFNFLVEAVRTLRSHEPAAFNSLATAVFAASALVKEGLARFSFWAWRSSGMRALKADGWHHRSDALASAVILAGIFLGRLYWWIDGALGIVVALLIVYAAYDILRGGIDPLIGESPDRRLVGRIGSIAARFTPEDVKIHHVHMHRYGDHTELTFHMKLSGSHSLEETHAVANRIEEGLREELGVEATIHVEPYSPGGR